jgi:hypothetical protein
MADQAVRDSARVVQTTSPFSPISVLAADRIAARIARDVISKFIASGETAALDFCRREIKLALTVAGTGDRNLNSLA